MQSHDILKVNLAWLISTFSLLCFTNQRFNPQRQLDEQLIWHMKSVWILHIFMWLEGWLSLSFGNA